jgi:hypothetical protein
MLKKISIFLLICNSSLFAQKTNMPIMEALFGPTSTNACVGNNRLTVGISKYGELVNLKWPCSNFFDHLNYKTLYPVPWGTKIDDYDRYLGANEKEGSYAALQYTENGKVIVSPLRSQEWITTQTYLNDNAPIVITSFENTQLGLTVTCTDLVSMQEDALFRHFTVKKNNNKSLSNISLIYLTNMAPCNDKAMFNPNNDWAKDGSNGYANVYDSQNDYFISFNPNKESKNNNNLPKNDTSNAEIQSFIAQIDNLYPAKPKLNNIDIADVYCIVGSGSKMQSKALYEDKAKKTNMPNLSESNNVLFAKNNAILISKYEIDLSKKDNAEVDIIFTYSNNLKNAIAIYNKAKLNTYKNELTTTVNYWDAKINLAKLPNVQDAKMVKTLKRILINILISTNADGGGIGSSVSATQPAYTNIWIRDAAIMSFVLDLAGYNKEAEKNNLFFTVNQRKKDFELCRNPQNFECFKGTWYQCYYADGIPSWDYDFEIDEVGWGAWMFYMHSKFLNGTDKVNYLHKVYPSIILAADFLVTYKDVFTNLQKRSREDDVLWKDQSIYGAASVLLGLKSAVSSAKLMNDIDRQNKWQKRIDELEKAIDKWLWNKNKQEYQQAIYGNFGGRSIIIWPALMGDVNKERIQLHAIGINKQIDPFFLKSDDAKNKEWWYLGKATNAIAFASKDNPDLKIQSKKQLNILLKEACTQDTYVYGETPMVRDIKDKNETKRVYDNRVGQPSNHPAAWFYMTAVMLYGSNTELLYNLYK